MASYSVADVGELEAEGPGGMVRKAVDAKAFGFNYFVFPPETKGHEHDETKSNQEEVLFCVKGSGALWIDGDEVDFGPGRFVRIAPEARRVPVSGPEGLEFITIGAPLDKQYEPPSWG